MKDNSALKNAIRFGALLGLSFAIHTATSGPASADAFADCVRGTVSADMVAKVQFQRDLRNLIVQNRPRFEALATINMQLQILYAEARRRKFDYLLAHDPERIDTANGLSRFSNFAWSDQDSNNFMAGSDSYRDLETRISQKKDQNNGHPDWPEMRAYFRSELNQSAEFNGVMARFQDRQRAVEADVAQCRRN